MNLLAATTPAANQVTSLPTDNTSEPERYDTMVLKELFPHQWHK